MATVVVRDGATCRALRDLYLPGWYEYLSMAAAGLVPWAPVTDEEKETAARAQASAFADAAAEGPGGFAEHLDTVPLLIVVLGDLRRLACVDRGFDRYTFVGGASLYPFCWSLLLAGVAEGLAGVMTTMVVRHEPDVQALLGAPPTMAVAAAGRPRPPGPPAHAPHACPGRGVRHRGPPRRATAQRVELTARGDGPVAAKRPVDTVAFRVDDTDVAVRAMDDLAATHRGWINLLPAVPADEEPPPPSPLVAVFSSDIHVVPVCTWVAGKAGRHGVRPDSVGVQHATGPRAIRRLASVGVPLPDGWRWTQDHPRRGNRLAISLERGHPCRGPRLGDAGASALCPIRLTGDWTAEIHRASVRYGRLRRRVPARRRVAGCRHGHHGAARRSAPAEPSNGAPRANTPPSAPTSQ